MKGLFSVRLLSHNEGTLHSGITKYLVKMSRLQPGSADITWVIIS